MKYTIVIEKVTEKPFPPGYYYAHIPVLDLTTHGLGIEGAKKAAKDLVKLWLEERKANGEHIKIEEETLISDVEIEDALLR